MVRMGIVAPGGRVWRAAPKGQVRAGWASNAAWQCVSYERCQGWSLGLNRFETSCHNVYTVVALYRTRVPFIVYAP